MTPDHDKPNPLLLDREQVATWLNVDASTVDNLHRFKRLRGCKVGKSLRWKPKDVERFATDLQPDD